MEQPLKILLLEDSKTDAEIIQRLLLKQEMKYEFSLAMTRKTFLLSLEEFIPDVILSDNSLPQFNAIDALKITRQRYPHIPFILVTGTVSEEYSADVIKLGADDYVLKDRMTRLPAAIEAALKQRKALKEIADYKYALDESADVTITDQKGTIIYANENFCKISRYSAEELIGKDHRITNSGYHPASFIKNLWVTIAHGRIWHGEFRNKAKDGSFYWEDTTIIPFLDPKRKPYQYLAIRKDVTKRKEAEEELLQSEMKLKEAQAIAHISNWEVDLEQNINTWSDEFYRIYGLTKGEVQPSPELFLSFMHPDNADYAQKIVQQAFNTSKDTSFEFRFIRKDGTIRYGYSESRFEFDKKGKPVRLFGILQDITERKEAEQNLKVLQEKIQEQKIQEQKKITRAIIKAQERERNRIGQELHDNVNQILASTKMYLGMAGRDNAKMQELIKYPMELIESSIQEIRLLTSSQVTPLRDINLKELIQSLLDTVTKDTTIKTNFVYKVINEAIDDDLKLNIYRIIQEQINNIMKHAAPKNVNVSVQANHKTIHVVVTDDGKGFNVNQKRKGIGISNMINRIESFNGEVAIESSPGNGCAVQIKIPY